MKKITDLIIIALCIGILSISLLTCNLNQSTIYTGVLREATFHPSQSWNGTSKWELEFTDGRRYIVITRCMKSVIQVGETYKLYRDRDGYLCARSPDEIS